MGDSGGDGGGGIGIGPGGIDRHLSCRGRPAVTPVASGVWRPGPGRNQGWVSRQRMARIESSKDSAGVTVACSTSPQAMATEAERVLIAVADAGPGVPRELRRNIFDPFFTTNVLGQGNLAGRVR